MYLEKQNDRKITQGWQSDRLVRILSTGLSSLLAYTPGLTKNATRWQHITPLFGGGGGGGGGALKLCDQLFQYRNTE